MKIAFILLSLMIAYVIANKTTEGDGENVEELCVGSGGLVKKIIYVEDQSHLIEQGQRIALQGRPGKTGAKGQKGDVGPTGDKGEVGQAGERGFCSCAVTDERFNEIQTAQQQLISKNEEMSSKIEEMNRMNEETNSKIEEMNSKNEEMNSKNEEMNSKIEEMSSTIQEMRSKNEEMSSKNEEMNSKNEEMSSTIQQLQQQEEDIPKRLDCENKEGLYFGDKCFFMTKTETRRFSQAKNACTQQGGSQLASITSAELYNALVNFIRSQMEGSYYNMWTSGRYDPITGGQSIKWGDGTTADARWGWYPSGYPRTGSSYSTYTHIYLEVKKDASSPDTGLFNYPNYSAHPLCSST